MPQSETTAFWISGCDSTNDPAFIGQNNFPWGFNGLHRGGRYRTRPGFREVMAPPIAGVQADGLSPQGLAIFTPQEGVLHLVMAHGGKIYKAPVPFTSWTQIPGLSFFPFAERIIFTSTVRSQQTNPDGSITFFPEPFDVLMIQDGFTRPGYWDGISAGHVANVPIGQAAIWNSQRYWVGDGHKLHAGDIGDPLGFNEEKIVATGGFFVLPDEITAIAETPDLQSLLVFTRSTTTAFQSAILDRTQWSATPGFQRDLFRNIGCVGPFAVVNQYGVTWWMSFNGILGLDTALQTYRTRRIRYADTGLARSKKNLHKNLSRVCAGQFEDFLFFSWPSADRFNAHTAVMDQTSFETSAGENQSAGTQSAWAGVWKGIRPVQWVTAVIDGRNRCLNLSRDYAPNQGSDYVIGIWEAFCPQRADVTLDGTVRPIVCGFESRQLAYSKDVKKIVAVEADVSEARNTVGVSGFFNGRRSGFSALGSKDIQATQRNPDLTVIDQYAPQQRSLRFETILSADPAKQSAQSPYNQAIDLGFGVYLQWTGDMALDAIRIFFEPQPTTQVGRVEINETTARLVDWENNEQILTDPPPPVYPEPNNSAFVDTVTQRYIEPFYSSR